MIQVVVFGASEMFKVLVIHLNLRSLKKNLDKLEALILGLSSHPSVLCLSETWLSENDDPKCFLLQGYSQYLTKCRPSRGEDVMIQVRNELRIIKETETSFEEALFVLNFYSRKKVQSPNYL